jgi:hypothetical protein
VLAKQAVVVGVIAAGTEFMAFHYFLCGFRQHKAFLGLHAICKVARAGPAFACSDVLREAHIAGTFRYGARELDDKLSR